jgi:predicted HicB family RNase H-like nuclease
MAETEKKFTLRLPEDMHASVSQMADEDDRSLHSMVLRILREAIEQWQKDKPVPQGRAGQKGS